MTPVTIGLRPRSSPGALSLLLILTGVLGACASDGSGLFVHTSRMTDCAACHLSQYDATTTPSHREAGFPARCEYCHDTSDWGAAVFDHQLTLFPLTGAHAITRCAACHADGEYRGKPTMCVSCHLAAYDATTVPVHRTAGYSTDCVACHTTSTWLGATAPATK